MKTRIKSKLLIRKQSTNNNNKKTYPKLKYNKYNKKKPFKKIYKIIQNHYKNNATNTNKL